MWTPSYPRRNSRSADFNFGNIYLWDTAYRQFLASVDGRLHDQAASYEALPFFAFPIGSGRHPPGHRGHRGVLRRGAAAVLRLRGVTDEHRELLEAAYPGRFNFSEDRDNFDYVYLAESSPASPARSSTASATSATASSRSTAGSSSA